MWERLKNTKTLWLALAGIIGAVSSYLAGEIDWKALAGAILFALFQLTQRDATAKTELKTEAVQAEVAEITEIKRA